MYWLTYDGSFGGLLNCIYAVYERKITLVRICRVEHYLPDAFAQSVHIANDPDKAKRVWEGMKKRLTNKGLQWFYYAYLSGLPEMEEMLLAFSRMVFRHSENIENNYGNPTVLQLAKTAKKVGREKHRMEAFVRFRETKEGLYYASIEPDFNVLPLILPHFKKRYADQHWLIYDIRRKYGIHYSANDESTSEVKIDWAEGVKPGSECGHIFTLEEGWYQQLWQDYFKSSGITERKNMRLHIQHVPRRYWKYLTEKTA